MYGKIEQKCKVTRIKLVKRVLEFNNEANSIVYRRLLNNALEYECEIVSSDAMFIEPVAPIFVPKQITYYILIEFVNSILLPPEGLVKGYTTMPVDIAVFSMKDNEYRVVDIFSENNVKYALYGPKNEGLVARYYKTKFTHNIMKPEPFKESVVPLEIINSHNKWVKLSQILLDSRLLRFYYKREGIAYTQNIKVNVTSESTAVIEYEKEFPGDLFEARKPLKVSIFMPSHRRTEMMWGL